MSKVFLLTLYIDLYSCNYIMTQMSPAFSGSRAPQDVQLAKGISFRKMSYRLHPGRLTWNLKMVVWKMIFLFKLVVFGFHVNLPGWDLYNFGGEEC